MPDKLLQAAILTVMLELVVGISLSTQSQIKFLGNLTQVSGELNWEESLKDFQSLIPIPHPHHNFTPPGFTRQPLIDT